MNVWLKMSLRDPDLGSSGEGAGRWLEGEKEREVGEGVSRDVGEWRGDSGEREEASRSGSERSSTMRSVERRRVRETSSRLRKADGGWDGLPCEGRNLGGWRGQRCWASQGEQGAPGVLARLSRRHVECTVGHEDISIAH